MTQSPRPSTAALSFRRLAKIFALAALLATTAEAAHSVILYELSRSGQAGRSGFYGLAGQIEATTAMDGFRIKASGHLPMGAKVVVSGGVDSTGLYIMELPLGAAPDWEVSLLAGDGVVAGPLAVSIEKPGLGLDWTVSEGDAATDIVRQTHPSWNREVTRAIVRARAALPVLVAKNERPAPPPKSIMVLEKVDPTSGRPEFTSERVDDLEDELLIALASRFSEPATIDRCLEKLGLSNAVHVQVHAYNVGTEAVWITIDMLKPSNGRESLRVYLAKVEPPANMDATTVKRHAGRVYSPWGRSVGPEVSSPLPNRIGNYRRWSSAAAEIAVRHGDLIIAIDLTTRNNASLTKDRMLALLEELEAMVAQASTP